MLQPQHCPMGRAFTLIEVLVVVAIIALLISIVMPGFRQARDQSKLAVCKSNCKQVANMTAAYQAEYRGQVPVVLSWRANRFYGTPPRATWLSFALRRYDGRRGRLPTEYNPDAPGTWSDEKRERYEAQVLPEYFVCPFEIGRGPRHEVRLGNTTDMEVRGRHEAIQTWLWEDIVRGHPYGPPAKYSALAWNQVCAGGPVPLPGCVGTPTAACSQADFDRILNRHRTWTTRDTHRLRGSFSALTIAFCYQGEHMEFVYPSGGDRPTARKADPRWNPGSHRTSRGGGSPAIFADSHVEWVPGPKIGWP